MKNPSEAQACQPLVPITLKDKFKPHALRDCNFDSFAQPCLVCRIRCSIVVSISACHAEGPGSIPGGGVKKPSLHCRQECQSTGTLTGQCPWRLAAWGEERRGSDGSRKGMAICSRDRRTALLAWGQLSQFAMMLMTKG